MSRLLYYKIERVLRLVIDVKSIRKDILEKKKSFKVRLLLNEFYK